MATTHQDTNVNQLVINKLTKQEYDNLSQVSDTELYLVEEQIDDTVTQGSTNPVQSGAVYSAIQDNHEIIFCHMLSGKIFNETVIECTEVNGEIFDPQELIDRPNDPRPLFPDGNYYYATNTNKVYSGEVGDNEFTDVTASVMMSGDETKLYCDIDDNKLYRYDGTNFVALTSNFSGDYNDLINNPFFVANNRLKYTDGPNTWVIPLMDDFSNNQNDYSKQILIYNGTGGIGPSMNIINHIADNDLLDYLPANYTIQDFVKAIADYYIQYKNDLLSGHNYFSVYGKAWRIRISPPEFYNYRFDYIKYNNDYIAKIEISALDSSYSAVGWYNNTTWTFEETTLKQVAFSGSYNDLTEKPLSVVSNKVKYTLEDGTTQLTLAQEDDFVAKAGDTITGTLILSKQQDASGTANNKPALIVGGIDTQAHIEIDNNEIIAKSNGTTGDKLWLQDGNGALGLVGSDYSVSNPDKFLAALGSGVTTKSYPTGGGSYVVYKWGRFCMLSFSTTVSASSGILQTIADAAYRPIVTVYTVVCAGATSSQAYYTAIYVDTNGKINYSYSFYRNGTNTMSGSDATRPISGTICYISAS